MIEHRLVLGQTLDRAQLGQSLRRREVRRFDDLEAFRARPALRAFGGLTNKMPGRIGDTSIVGAGVYANDTTCAVSSTGTGEHFIRGCIAYDVHARMRYLAHDVTRAAGDSIVECLQPLGGRGGVIAVGRDGQIAMPFNSPGMYRAWIRDGALPQAAVFAA